MDFPNMKYLYYDLLKTQTEHKIDLPLDVAEFLGKDLRKKIAEKASKEEVNKIYDEMEKNCAMCFLMMNMDLKEEICKMFLINENEKFKEKFIERFNTCKINNIVTGDRIFVKPNFLDMFFKYLFPKIKKKFYLYTGASDYSIDYKYLKYLNNNKIINWIGHNIELNHKKVIKIPIGFSNKTSENEKLLDDLYKLKKEYSNKKCKLLITYMEETNKKRKKIKRIFDDKKWVEFCNKCDFESYMKHINNYRFILCPRGNGIDTYRFWETNFMGSVPIVESSNLDDLYKKVNCIIVNKFEDLKEEDLKNYIKRSCGNNSLEFSYWMK